MRGRKRSARALGVDRALSTCRGTLGERLQISL